MADDVIRLNIELDDSKAKQQANRFIADLERRIKELSRQLSNALVDGVGDTASDEVKKLTRELDKLQRELKDVQRDSQRAEQGFGRLGVRLRTVAAGAAALGFAAVARGFSNAASEAFVLSARFEQTETALQGLVARERQAAGEFDNLSDAFENSSQQAEELLGFIFQLARESPFSRETIQDTFQQQLAFGFTIEQAKELTQAQIDLAAGTGRSAEVIQRFGLALGQIRARGTLAGSELRQLQEAGFDANAVLSDLGFSLEDVSNNLVDAEVFIAALTERIERDFGGAAARATNTLQGLSSTLQDLREDALREFFGASLGLLQPQLQEFAENFDEIQPSIAAAGEELGELLNIILTRGPSASATIDTIAAAFANLADFILGARAVTGGLADGLERELSAQLEGIEAVERVQRLASAADAGGGAGDIFGFTGTINDEAITALEEIVAGSEDLEEAQRRLEDAFGDSIQEFRDFNTIVIRTERGTLNLNGTYEDLFDTTVANAEAQRELAQDVFNTSAALEVEELSAENLAIAQERLAEATEETIRTNEDFDDKVQQQATRLDEQGVRLAEASANWNSYRDSVQQSEQAQAQQAAALAESNRALAEQNSELSDLFNNTDEASTAQFDLNSVIIQSIRANSDNALATAAAEIALGNYSEEVQRARLEQALLTQVVGQLAEGFDFQTDSVADFISQAREATNVISQGFDIAFSAEGIEGVFEATEGIQQQIAGIGDSEILVRTITNANAINVELEETQRTADLIASKEYPIVFDTNADEAGSEIDQIDSKLDALDGRTVTVNVDVRQTTTAETGGVGPGSVPVPEDTFPEAQKGGFFPGNPNEIVGLFHGDELVVPSPVIRKGIDAIAGFAVSNVPSVRREATAGTRMVASTALPPSVTNITNTTSGNTVNDGRSTVNNIFELPRGDNQTRGLVRVQENQRQNDLMKRGGRRLL